MSDSKISDIIKPGEFSDRDKQMMEEATKEKIRKWQMEQNKIRETTPQETQQQQQKVIIDNANADSQATSVPAKDNVVETIDQNTIGQKSSSPEGQQQLHEQEKETEPSQNVNEQEQESIGERQQAEDITPQEKEWEEFLESHNIRAREAMSKFSRLDRYEFVFEDGTSKQYYRKPLSVKKMREMDKLVTQHDTAKSIFEKRGIQAKMACVYLYDENTNKPMTIEEAESIEDSDRLNLIVFACLGRTQLGIKHDQSFL